MTLTLLIDLVHTGNVWSCINYFAPTPAGGKVLQSVCLYIIRSVLLWEGSAPPRIYRHPQNWKWLWMTS